VSCTLRRVLPEDVYQLGWASDPRVSPDGRTVAFVANGIDREANEYRAAIWLVAADGSSPPRRLTAGARQDVAPRWSPDGTQIAFASNRECDAKQLYVMPVDGGEPSRLTDLKEDVTEAVWSRDGSRIAFTARVRDDAYEEEDDKRRRPRRFTRLQYKLDDVGWVGDRRRQIFVVPVDGSAAPTQITSGDYEAKEPSWAPDGRHIAFSSARHDDWDMDNHSDVFLVSAAGGEPRRLTATDAIHDAPSWSPDGTRIACHFNPGGWDEPRHGQICVLDAATGERRFLTQSLDLQCTPYPDFREPVWESDRSILFTVEDAGNIHVYRVAADGYDAPELVIGGERWAYSYDHAGGTLVHASSTPAAPAEIFAGDWRLTDVGHSFRERCALVEAEPFTAVSEDGSEVDAWIVRPPDFDPARSYPVLLSIHGGPFAQYGNKFFDEFQVYARAGYVVLYANPRGSSGYSEAWGRAIRGPVDGGPGWGSVDYADLMAVVDEALRRFPECDPERLGVLGGSYGGYMTSWIVGHTDRFRAALSERAVNNLLSEFGSSDFGWFSKAYTGVFPFENLDPYIAQSPTTYATNITTPLLILHSEEDLRCNVEQAEHLFSILRLLKREVELVRFPAEGHELTRSGSPVHRVMRFEIVLDWFGRYLRPGR
jgi:dipeptidyl aminopeptidase/acylaminoacyl peptidase